MRNLAIKIMLVLSVAFLNNATAAKLNFTNTISGASIIVSTPVVSFIEQENMFSSLPTTPGFVNSSVKNRVSVGVDHSSLNYVGASYHYRYKLRVEAWDNNVLLPTSTTDIYLSVQYDPAATSSFRDLSTYSFTDGHKVKVSILEIYDYNTSSNITNPPDNMKVTIDIDVERYYDFIPTTTISAISHLGNDLNGDTKIDQLDISWSAISGAEEYELEWTYVDDYDVTLTTPKALSSIAWNFKGDNTRVTIPGTNYKINLTYDRGYVIYRVRGIGKHTYSPYLPIYGAWNKAESGTNPSTGSGCTACYFNVSEHEYKLNWQYTGTFAEEGKKKEVMGYFDGSLRSRQTVTINNSDNNAIAGESYYDYQGRKAVDALPVPTGNSALGYNPNFNVNVSFNRYSKLDFDLDGLDSCHSAIGPMSNTSGSSKYYSPSNPNNTGNNAFIPDAEQYPFSQVEYTPDNTGRIRRMGGVGPDHQLNSDHETKYYYGQPTQWELDRLFGSEVGYNNHYKKNMVIDPNGQVSISYLDMHGRVVATALSGETPTNVSSINSDASININVDLLSKDANGKSLNNYINAYFNELIYNSQFLVSVPGEHIINYSLEMPQVTDSCLSSSMCFDCIYDLRIVVKDECGKVVYESKTEKVGSPALNSTCGSTITFPSSPSPATLNLGIGNYQISKVLTINEDAYNYYLSLYLSPAGNSCFVSYDAMLEQEKSLINYDDCNFSCQRCVQALGSKDEYVVSGRGNEAEWLEAYNICIEPCKAVSPCEVMLLAMKADMSPGGQYGEYYDSTINKIQVFNFHLSVFNIDNLLPDGGVSSSSGGAYWRNPKLPNGTLGYYEEDKATRTKVSIQKDITGAFIPSIISNTYAYGTEATGYYTYPEYLSNLDDLLGLWNSSWAYSLVVYHPEYCYNQWCVENLEKVTVAGQTASYEFDDAIDQVETYADAVSKGYISGTPSVTTLTSLDPYFQYVNTAQASEMNVKCSTYVSHNTVNYSILQIAAMTAKCGSFYGDNYSSSCLTFGTGTTEELDKMWLNLKSFYLSYKQQLIKEAADNYVLTSGCKGYNKCIGAEDYNPFSSKAYGMSSSAYWSNSYQACAYNTYKLYKTKQKRFLIGDLDVIASQEDINFSYFNNTGKCPGETAMFELLNEIASKGELNTTKDLHSYISYTPWLYEQITGSTPGGIFTEYETVSTITGSSSEKLKLDFRLKGSSTLFNCGFSFEFINNPSGYTWSDIVGFSSAKLIQNDPVGGTNLYDIIVMVNDGVSPNPVPFTIRGKLCGLFASCEFYDDCKPTDYAKGLQILMSALAYNAQLTSTTTINLETSYPTYLTRQIRNVVGGVNYTNLRWIYNGSGSFTLNDPTTLPTGTSINISVASYDPSTFTHSDLQYIKYFDGLRIDPSNIEHGFIVDGWYLPGGSGTSLQKVTITFNSSFGITARCFDPVPLNCNTPEFKAQRDLEILLQEVLIPNPSAEIDLSSNENYTDILESYLGFGHAFLLKPEYTNDDIKTYIQVRATSSPSSQVLNQCSVKFFRLNEAYSTLNNFNSIIEFSNLHATELEMVDGKSYYFTIDATFSNGLVETIGGYTSCIPLMDCGCYKKEINSCQNDYKAIIDYTSKYNSNFLGNNPMSFELTPLPDFSQFNCQCGKDYLQYLLNYTTVETPPLSFVEYVENHCIPKGMYCPEYTAYYKAVKRYNDEHPTAKIDFETNVNTENCNCIESYTDYLATFNSTSPIFSGPPMSLSDYLAAGCTFPGVTPDACSSLLATFTSALNTKISQFNSTVVPPSSSLPGAPLPTATPTSADCNCIIRYIAMLDKYIMNGLANPGIMSTFTAAPDFNTFVANGCQGPCISEYFIYAETMENAGITPNAYDQSKCDCYLYYTNYFNDNYIDGVFMGVSLDDYCSSPPPMMMMARGTVTSGGSVKDQNKETESEIDILKEDNLKKYKEDTTILKNDLETFSRLSMEGYEYVPKPRTPCTPPDTVMLPQVELINSCFEYLDDVAELIAKSRYEEQIQYFTSRFRNTYLNKCMQPVEDLDMTMPNKDYHYTLYYYDQGGNLVRTVPPAGVKLITNSTQLIQVIADRTNDEREVYTKHGLATTYEYNSLNQLMRQSIPDNDLMNRWTVYNNSSGIPSGTTLIDLKFVDANVGYLIGNGSVGAELYRTNDGGKTFNPLSIQTSDLKKVQMLDANNGYAVGLNGLFFRTTNGGGNWQIVQLYNGTTPKTETINDFYFNSTTDGILVGDNGLICHATYSSEWTFVYNTSSAINYKSVDFTNSTNGFVVADNAGTAEVYIISSSWPSTASAFTLTNNSINAKLRGVDINKSYFINSNDGYAAGKDGQVFKTTDGGVNWTHIATNVTVEFKDLYFVDANNGLALAADGMFYSSSNGAATWNAISAIGVYQAMHIYDKTSAIKYGYAAGDDGLVASILYQSGKGFRIFKRDLFTPVTTDFTSVFGLSNTEFFVGGNSGALAKINQVGRDWSLTSISTGISSTIKKMYFASNTLGMLLEDNGNLQKVTYSGSWTVAAITGTGVSNVKDFDYNSTHFVFLKSPSSSSPETYYLSNGTLSSGISFVSAYTTSAANLELYSVNFINGVSDHIANGLNGAIYKYSGSAFANNSAKTTPLKLNKIRAISGSSTVFVAADNGSVIQSTDNGTTWKMLASGSAENLNDLDAVSTSEVYFAGNKGTLLKFTSSVASLNSGSTQDLLSVKKFGSTSVVAGGKNKTLVLSSNSGSTFAKILLPSFFTSTGNGNINSITSNSTNVWLTGGNGVIYKYSGGTFSITYNTPVNCNDININTKNLNGLILCNNATVITTTNNGNTWKLQANIGTDRSINFNTGWVFSGTNYLIASTNAWTKLWNPKTNALTTPSGLGTSSTFKDVAFNHKGQGVMINNTNGVFYSYNYGASFSSSTISGATLNSVDVEGSEAYIVGNSNSVYYYTGISNTALGSPATHTVPTSSANLTKITLLDMGIGYILSNNGQVIKMMNPSLGTPSFYQQYSDVSNTNTSTNLLAVDFNKRGNLVFAGASGYVRQVDDDARTISNIFWYDELGRLIVSQNSKQFGYTTPAYSYTLFDALGRIVQVGEALSTGGPEDYMLVNNLQYSAVEIWLSSASKRQVTNTYYDDAFAPSGAGITQINLRKRVASITYEESFDGNPATYDHASHYTYDIHGNVDVMVQELPTLSTYGSQFKKIRYEYDLVSGKVNNVHFNEGQLDQFHHKYIYDADNRITRVETSRDDINWDVDATYQYYAHGPLMRSEIGDLNVQGVDFAYTLHGWIKGVNAGILDPDRDMGRDGKVVTGNMNQYVARDAFGYLLGYYNNSASGVEDYKAINSSGINHFSPATAGSDLINNREDLYNGNITSMQTVLPNCSTYNASRTISSETFGNAYKYDQLNRIKSSRTFTNLNTTTNTWGNTGSVSTNFGTDYEYDANGNIISLDRWGNGTKMDEFTYNYNIDASTSILVSNRLYHVNDATSLSGNYADDIDDQGAFTSTPSTINTANNYGYDELGNLSRDDAEEISSIEWNVQGKITKVNRTTGSTKATLEFTYDAMGQRLTKKVTESSGNIKTFYYIRDAQGNEMCRYVKYTESGITYFVSEEHSIYGSSRLGLQTRRDTLYANSVITPSYDYVCRNSGTKQYELSNHLGNVLVTVTDQHKPVSALGIIIDSYTPVIVSISDYYPFGSSLPSRAWSDVSRGYRYGFNGKEKDSETANDAYDFGARIYDGRLGRWLSVDPFSKIYPNASNFLFSHNSPISLFDPSGKIVIIGTLYSFNSGGKDVIVNSPIVSTYINQFASKQNGDQRFYQHTISQENGRYEGQVNLSFSSVARSSETGKKMITANQDAQTTFTYNLSDGTSVAATAYVPIAGINVVSINADIQVLSDEIVEPKNVVGAQSKGNQEAMGAALTAVAIVNELYTSIDALTNTLNTNTVEGSVNLDNVAQQFTTLLNGSTPLPVSPALSGALNDLQNKNSSTNSGYYIQYNRVDATNQNNTVTCRIKSSISDIINSNPGSPISKKNYIYPIMIKHNLDANAGTNSDYIPTPDNERDVNAIKCN